MIDRLLFNLAPLALLLILVAGCVNAGRVSTSTSGPATDARPSQASLTPPADLVRPSSPELTSSSSVLTSPLAAPTQPPSAVAAEILASPLATPTSSRPRATDVSPSPAPSVIPQTPTLAAVHLGLAPVASGLDRPLFVTHAGDGSGRVFIVEKGGTIRVLEKGQLLPRPFLDIRERVLSRSSEQGLLGLAFAPDFSRSGYFFVDYIDLSGNTVISRFQLTSDPNVADPASEFKVLGIDQPAANHNGGNLVFGPDGYLWIGTGDGGGANDRFGNGQNPQTLLGKMLRLDVTSDLSAPYTVPPDNPWVNAKWNGQDILPEIWAVGLRNPWRYSFDRSTGDLWIADVGQNEHEEINRVPAGSGGKLAGGLNFGWPIMEGTHCFPDGASCARDGLVIPVWDYQHGEDGCSITGASVYRGTNIAGLVGAYLYGDYCSGRIWALAQDVQGEWGSQLLLDSGLSISSFGEDEAGELYVADLAGSGIYRLVGD
jgi:glucose/arabinose dehydrogenase